MTDIINVFPTADEVRKYGKDGFSLYLFEEELRSILRLIGWAEAKKIGFICLTTPSDEAIEFLLEKGYQVVNDKDDSWMISWD